MYKFPKDLFTDVRIEEVCTTEINLKNSVLVQNKTKKDRGAMIRIYDGNKWYYSATTDLESIQQQIDTLSQMATKNHNILNNKVVKALEINNEICLKYKSNNISNVENKKKLNLVKSYLPILEKYNDIKTNSVYLSDNYTKKQIISSIGTDVTFDSQYIGVAIGYTITENGLPFRGNYSFTKECFDDIEDVSEMLVKRIESDIEYAKEAKPIKPGIYTCILSPITTGVFAHESFGHKSESDFMIGDETMKKEWAIGTKVGSSILNIIDTGTITGAGYVPFDDEGCKAKKNYIIKNGVLSGRLHSAYTASDLEEKVTGNARAMNFEFEPIVRMTNTYIENGDMTKEELISGVKEGIYIDDISHGSGMSTFTIAPRKAYMVRDGKIAEPVKVAVITGNVMETLHEIDGLSKEYEILSFVTGGCGKMEQYPLHVGFGGPYVRVNNINVQ
ncbi:TldD/PmbA family protein [Sedimentibacter sp. zth1]|uniref:TldD/PmbA family protein n=1 Tax=Sedimentibacter sp. zth1 TaxID=2816908 RepID=UPI001A931280|nr:TldD/PmbA family protein [Sedimentibacter sp. zth1]QSX04744.1 TldD/PmbA family protein [Sedimentibacter sp. zth1]